MNGLPTPDAAAQQAPAKSPLSSGCAPRSNTSRIADPARINPCLKH
ncbi:hypothetical protein F8B43_3216 [Methylorubrum populi]|uniref:Uncharacterized protein n=1 Tax=Methylorubrum populi TaxID=223967 RepID=A0A833J5V3_9HYPH|nr:hypothetical protein F8B43_3216 [Methylorubrum populi]